MNIYSLTANGPTDMPRAYTDAQGEGGTACVPSVRVESLSLWRTMASTILLIIALLTGCVGEKRDTCVGVTDSNESSQPRCKPSAE